MRGDLADLLNSLKNAVWFTWLGLLKPESLRKNCSAAA
ncbi:MAG: hypothetical protein ACI9P7_002234, partial [Candidatus Azotimanducaceae bacterium]